MSQNVYVDIFGGKDVALKISFYKYNLNPYELFLVFFFLFFYRFGNPSGFFVLNGDVCSDFPLSEILQFHKSKDNALMTIMATETTKQQALNYGCIAKHPTLDHMTHYVEKPSTFVSTLISCGVFFCSLQIFDKLAAAVNEKQQNAFK